MAIHKKSIRAKAKLKGEITEVKALIKHPMESGFRKDKETGDLVPAHFIKELKCEHNDKVVMSAIWSGGISKNPYCAFRFKGAAKGDKVKISWEDNLGHTDTRDAKVK
ncbi:thiosulfate oxidation carrier complex protein SoxZ [Candidatus Parabeggiatoa sp. HSG14]|uniref:thiosulfate oxidation carrier complex protein SoxZ n=1 Tax=Candidatus Parabeggiatoa sp. HSG14 TaxID=3055593 RepID=UPI0025A76031|nr:thiosulfate oxidation carrier complex protein SoxZ [Thiotrichales bacterium HSG14]